MTHLKLAALCACICAGALVACGSDDGNASTGPDAALDARDCYLGLTVPGGVAYAGYACSGSSQASTVSGLGPDSFNDVRLTVSLSLDAPPAIGALELASLSVSIPSATSTPAQWDAPVNSCTATAPKSATDADFGWIYYRIDIVCTEPATPAADNPGAPMDLGEFSIVTFFH